MKIPNHPFYGGNYIYLFDFGEEGTHSFNCGLEAQDFAYDNLDGCDAVERRSAKKIIFYDIDYQGEVIATMSIKNNQRVITAKGDYS